MTATRRIAFSGDAWLDHQWGSFQADPRAFNWDWFSCRFHDRTELMLYRFRDRETGTPLAAFRNGTFVRRDGTSTPVTHFTATSDGAHWPQTWTLDNFARAWDGANFAGYSINTLIISTSVVAIVVIVSSLAGYALIYTRLEYYDRALEYSRRALEVNPNMDGVRRNIDLLERLLEQRRGRMI